MIRQYWLEFWKWLWYALPSSYFLAKRIVASSYLRDQTTIVELWWGSWVVTAEILSCISAGATLHVFENDENQVAILKDRFAEHPQIHIYSDSAAHIDKYFSPGSVDVVISTLPLGSILKEGVHHILQSAQTVLKSGGQYIQYQFWMANRRDVKAYFHIENTKLELRNYGPAFIYQARKIGQ